MGPIDLSEAQTHCLIEEVIEFQACSSKTTKRRIDIERVGRESGDIPTLLLPKCNINKNGDVVKEDIVPGAEVSIEEAHRLMTTAINTLGCFQANRYL